MFEMRPRLFLLLGVAAGALGALGWFLWVRQPGRGPHPEQLTLPGSSAEVLIKRDSHGVPHVAAKTRLDAVRALGFLHAIDRPSQLDLSRRAGSGTRSELLGESMVEADERARILNLKAAADAIWEQLPENQKDRLKAYADGVNAGLQAIGGRSAWHRALGVMMEPWQPADAVLVALGHFITLQPSGWDKERRLGEIRDRMGTAWADFFEDPAGSPAVPGPAFLDLRNAGTGEEGLPSALFDEAAALAENEKRALSPQGILSAKTTAESPTVGVTWYGGVELPSLFYPGVLEFIDEKGNPKRVVGLSSPGLPLLLFGTNGSVAWGVAPLAADITDLVLLPRSDIDPEVLYVQGRQILKIDSRPERLEVRGAKARDLSILESQWGAIAGRGEKQQYLAVLSTTRDPSSVNFAFADLEIAHNAAQASSIARESALVPLTLTLADATGETLQTAIGRVPIRKGYDGKVPVIFAYDDRSWEGLETARITQGSERDGARRADVTEEWAKRLRTTLEVEPPADRREAWNRLRSASEDPIAGPAAAELFGRCVRARVLGPLFRRVASRYPEFEYGSLPANEAVFRLIREQPEHLLDPRYESWDAVLVNAAVDASERVEDVENAVRRSRTVSPLLARSLRARIAFPASGLPLPADRHASLSAEEAVAGDILRLSMATDGRLEFGLAGGPSDNPASQSFAQWHENWLQGSILQVAIGTKDATTVLPPP